LRPSVRSVRVRRTSLFDKLKTAGVPQLFGELRFEGLGPAHEVPVDLRLADGLLR
jgi:hypothetical protein